MNNLYYRENMMDHAKNPRNWGAINNPDYKLKIVNKNCGDIFNLYLKTQKLKIDKISFNGEGCAVSVASASMILENLEGTDLNNIGKISKEDILVNFGEDLTPSRKKCALLIYKGLRELNNKIKNN